MPALWLFALAIAYPYLPGSDSDAFKGVSVFAGLMVSLGSSGLVNQVMSGFTLIYSRALREGDFVAIGDVEGTVAQLGTLSTKIRTAANEDVTIPNAVVVGQVVTNYTRGAEEGVFVPTEVTIGYDVAWRQVEARCSCCGIEDTGQCARPAPAVRQSALQDAYVKYTLLFCLEDPTKRRPVRAAVNANILDAFNEYGVQITSPNYEADPTDKKIVPREKWYPGSGVGRVAQEDSNDGGYCRSNPTSTQPVAVRLKNTRTGCAHDGCSALVAAMSIWMKLSAAGRQIPRRLHRRVALCVSAIFCVAPVALSNRDQPRGIRTRGFGEAGGHRGVLEGERAVGVEARVDDRVDGVEVDPADRVAALDQDVAEMLFRRRVAVLAGAHRRADQLVGERHHPPRRPERIVGAQFHVGRGRRLRLPRRSDRTRRLRSGRSSGIRRSRRSATDSTQIRTTAAGAVTHRPRRSARSRCPTRAGRWPCRTSSRRPAGSASRRRGRSR